MEYLTPFLIVLTIQLLTHMLHCHANSQCWLAGLNNIKTSNLYHQDSCHVSQQCSWAFCWRRCMLVHPGECRRRGRRHSSTYCGQRTSTCGPDIACSVCSRSGEHSNHSSASDKDESLRQRKDRTDRILSGLAGRPYSRRRTSYTNLSTRISPSFSHRTFCHFYLCK